MNYSWSKTVFPIAAIFSFRLLGLFLLIPVFTVQARHLQGATPALIGIALGGYGLTQGLLQIPFGMLSDKFGRKPIISLGLLLFALGSLLGALSDSIYGMILARILQGTGAIGSVLIALLADLTPDNQRTTAMAVIGMSIATSFGLAMIISTVLSQHFGLPGIFYFTVALAIMGLLLLHLLIPTPLKEIGNEAGLLPSLLKTVVCDPPLQRLNFGIFCQHFILTATFFSVPLLLSQQTAHLTQQWHFYLPLIMASFLCMIPLILYAEKKNHMKSIFLLSILTISLTQGILAFTHAHWAMLCFTLFVYFIAFNLLEATLPSLVSKQASPKSKGTAIGVYSTGQFLGIFAGGTFAGLLYQWGDHYGIFITNALIGGLWLVVASFMKSN